MNATGQNLLSNIRHEEGPGQEHPTSARDGKLPNININKASAAKEWNHLDGEQNFSGRGSDRGLSSKRE
jgi:hypothetical protein